MPTKLDYLKDLREHPHTTGGEAAARLDIPEATVLEAYRRARRQGLIEGDGGRPEKFVLTDAGLTQLRVLAGEGNPAPGLPVSVGAKLSELEEKVNDTVEDVKGLFGLVDRVLAAKGEPPSQPDANTEEMQAEIADLEEELAQRSRVMEFYAVETIMLASELGADAMFEDRQKKLAGELDSETKQAVRRLVKLEEELRKQRGKVFFGSGDRIRALEAEIAQLRGELGFSDGDSGQEPGKDSKKEPDGEGE